MKILWHSSAPWVGSGYGQQTATFVPRLAGLGHDVAVSATFGLQGAPLMWGEHVVYPKGESEQGSDVLPAHAVTHCGGSADGALVVTLMDVWALSPIPVAGLPTACWVPVDTNDQLSILDASWFARSGAVPIAMSRHGERLLAAAGLDPFYVPHGVDTELFAPLDDATREQARTALGVPDGAFAVGINAANAGRTPPRKAWPQQLAAFARFRQRCPEAFLLLHTNLAGKSTNGMDLETLLEAMDIPPDAWAVTDQYPYIAGMLDQQFVAGWYSACDVVMNATLGEGFGLATVEAQACGTPVIVCDNSASSELVAGGGWKVPGDPFYHSTHMANWSIPRVPALVKALESARRHGESRRDKARQFALAYDADRVTEEYWAPALPRIADRAARGLTRRLKENAA